MMRWREQLFLRKAQNLERHKKVDDYSSYK